MAGAGLWCVIYTDLLVRDVIFKQMVDVAAGHMIMRSNVFEVRNDFDHVSWAFKPELFQWGEMQT